ncbi:MAG: XRE family transcriptional regulator [Proteobacteria bacterium]|nr:XRE family transcriptional regulator [Pseudomonadota bacterium]
MAQAMRINMPIRGLRLPDAAGYFSMSESKFLELVAAKRAPAGFTVDRMRIWDIRDLDAAFDALKAGQENPVEQKPVDEDWDGVAP